MEKFVLRLPIFLFFINLRGIFKAYFFLDELTHMSEDDRGLGHFQFDFKLLLKPTLQNEIGDPHFHY